MQLLPSGGEKALESQKDSLPAVVSQALAATSPDSNERFRARRILPGMAKRLREVAVRFLPGPSHFPLQISRTSGGMPRHFSDRGTRWVGLSIGQLLWCLVADSYMLAGEYSCWLHLRIGPVHRRIPVSDRVRISLHLTSEDLPRKLWQKLTGWRRPLQLGPSVPPLVALTAEGGAEAQLSYEYGGTGGDSSGGAVPIYVAIGDVIHPPAPPLSLPSASCARANAVKSVHMLVWICTAETVCRWSLPSSNSRVPYSAMPSRNSTSHCASQLPLEGIIT